MEIINLIVDEDCFSKDYLIKNFSRNFYGYLKSTKATFFVNKQPVDISYHLKKDDHYQINYFNKKHDVMKSNKPIKVVYEDDYIIILDKEANLLTIPSRNNFNDSLYNRLAYHYSDCSLNVITRLDAKTSGLVLVSKKEYLVEKIKQSNIEKNYICKTSNPLPKSMGIIDLPIGRIDGVKRGVIIDGKKSITEYTLIDDTKYCYKIKLHTGRTHQIRVHLSSFSCPIDGDGLYGSEIISNKMQLICKNLKIIHPITERIIEVTSEYELE